MIQFGVGDVNTYKHTKSKLGLNTPPVMTSPIIFWFRRDLRLADHPGLASALAKGGPVIPVFILDPETESMGAAPKWRLQEALRVFGQSLDAIGSKLILRRGPAVETLKALVDETGADAVHWSRLYDPDAIARDTEVKKTLSEDGVHAESHAGHILFEPWSVKTGQGSFYRVYTPFWKAVRDRDPGAPLDPVREIPAPETWPSSDDLDDWQLGAAMRRGADIVKRHAKVGEAAAQDRLQDFLETSIDAYKAKRDRLDRDATSKLSENLTYGEISARTCWHAGFRAVQAGAQGAEHFVKEVVWRDFAYHLIYHTPHITTDNWREEWDAFPWQDDNDAAERWRQGRTGEPVIDAAMREMYVTGTMHNRARMLVASYLTKHLMTHWKVGLKWFEECLIDWDPASNAMGWQWAAGSGPDAAPYFRIFNPATQAEKFDPNATYRSRFVAELSEDPGEEALSYFDAVPRSWKLDRKDTYPAPMVDLMEGRNKALEAYSAHSALKKEVVA